MLIFCRSSFVSSVVIIKCSICFDLPILVIQLCALPVLLTDIHCWSILTIFLPFQYFCLFLGSKYYSDWYINLPLMFEFFFLLFILFQITFGFSLDCLAKCSLYIFLKECALIFTVSDTPMILLYHWVFLFVQEVLLFYSEAWLVQTCR